MSTTKESVVPFGIAQFSRDIWELIMSYCPLPAQSKLFTLNRALHKISFFENEKYLLHYCLNVFTAPRGSYYEYEETFSATHFTLSTITTIQQYCYQIYDIPRLFNIEEPEMECAIENKAPEVHRVLTIMLLHAPQFVTVAQQDVLVELMKYLPWKPSALVGHPFPKVHSMAVNGVQIANLPTKTLTTVQAIVPNVEDYANCIIYNDIDYSYDFYTLANALCDHESNFNETLMLIGKRGRSLMMYVNATISCKNAETLLFLLHSGEGLQQIDPSVFDDPSFLKKAILLQPHVLSIAPEKYKQDDALIKYAIANGKYAALLHASKQLQVKYMYYYLRGIKQSAGHILPEHWNDDDQVVTAFVKSWGGNITCASTRLQLNEDLVALSVSLYPNGYSSLHSVMQANKKVLRAALETDFQVISFVPAQIIASSATLQKAKQVLETHYRQSSMRKVPRPLADAVTAANINFATI